MTMNGLHKIIFVLGLILSQAISYAQDYNFSNHNTVPYSLNPASVGEANAIRLGVNYRMQWPVLNNNYHTVRVSYDQNVYKRMCSVGAFYTYDQMSSVYSVNEFGVVYSHTIRCAEKHFIRLGLQGSVFYNKVDYSSLTFGDQYDSNGFIAPGSMENLENTSKTFFDFAVGASYVFENHLTVGFAVYHVAQPENGFYDESSYLPRRYVGSVKFVQDLKLNRGLMSQGFSDNYFFANVNYQHQEDYKSAYLGVGVCFEPIIVGAAYKTNLDNVHTPSFMVGGYYKGFQLYYIFDIFASDKKNGSWSNEISLIYTFPQQNKKNRCPVVYW